MTNPTLSDQIDAWLNACRDEEAHRLQAVAAAAEFGRDPSAIDQAVDAREDYRLAWQRYAGAELGLVHALTRDGDPSPAVLHRGLVVWVEDGQVRTLPLIDPGDAGRRHPLS